MPRHAPVRWLGVLTALLTSLAALTLYMARRPLPPRLATQFDIRLRSAPGGWPYHLAGVLRPAGSLPVVVAAAVLGAALLVWRWHRFDLAALCLGAPLLAGLGEVVIRSQIDRVVSHTAALEGAFGYGFPSGHETGAAALAAVGVIAAFELSEDRRVRTWGLVSAIGLTAAVGVSSVVGGAHHTLDVVGGVMLGVSGAIAVALVVWLPQSVAALRPARTVHSGPR